MCSPGASCTHLCRRPSLITLLTTIFHNKIPPKDVPASRTVQTVLTVAMGVSGGFIRVLADDSFTTSQPITEEPDPPQADSPASRYFSLSPPPSPDNSLD